ncbi:MAG: rhamnulokinase [Acidobacteriia bacterium]|nr:rhamnulokinase [Terriglobia bacterium]
MSQYLAFDLGAESGRAVLGRLSGGRVEIEELHRFPNGPVRVHDALYWDALRLWQEIQQGIDIAARQRHVKLDGIGIDTWGVDFGLLGSDGLLIDMPRHYRDRRTHGVMERLFETVPREEVFAQTGIQFLPFNTLYQLYAMKQAASAALEAATRLLNMPDLFNYWLTGEARSEMTIASTTQLFDPRTRTWATGLIERLGLPCRLLGPTVAPGTLLGKTMEAPYAPVYATAGHDTAAAVAAVPAEENESWCYISSGTWSLMGVELAQPAIHPACLAFGCSNEVGVGGRIRLLKNIAGLWLLQECRRAWEREGSSYSYEQLAAMAAEARPFAAILDPDAVPDSDDMPRQIAEHCRGAGQEPPGTPAEYTRAILEGLALRYRQVLENLERLTGRKIETIHIVGGGSRNTLLNRFAADCTGRRVIAGPAEATAIGNILVQAMGSGELAHLEEARSVVRRSFAPQTFEPRPAPEWERAYERFRKITG